MISTPYRLIWNCNIPFSDHSLSQFEYFGENVRIQNNMLSCLEQKGKANDYVKKLIFFSSNNQTLYNKTETSQQNRVCILELLSQGSAAGIEQVGKGFSRRYDREE